MLRRGNSRGAKAPCCWRFSDNKEGKDGMTKTSIDLQDLRRRIYLKAKADPDWCFWGLYVHVWQVGDAPGGLQDGATQRRCRRH